MSYRFPSYQKADNANDKFLMLKHPTHKQHVYVYIGVEDFKDRVQTKIATQKDLPTLITLYKEEPPIYNRAGELLHKIDLVSWELQISRERKAAFAGGKVPHWLVPEAKVLIAYWNSALAGAPSESETRTFSRRGWDLLFPHSKQTNITLYLRGSQHIDNTDLVNQANKAKAKLNWQPTCLEYHSDILDLRILSANLYGLYTILISRTDYESLLDIQGVRAPLYRPYPNPGEAAEAHDAVCKMAYKLGFGRDQYSRGGQGTTTSVTSTKLGTKNDRPPCMGTTAATLATLFWGTGPNERAAEWLHRSAKSFGDIKSTLRRGENRHPNVPQNIIFGTYEANSLMIRSEDSVRRAARAVKTYPSAYKDVTLHTTAMRTRSTVFPTTQNYKNMADVWDGKYGWFAPLLEYKVTIKGTPLTGGTALFHSFTRRKFLKLEAELDSLVELAILGEEVTVPSRSLKKYKRKV